MPSRSPHVSFSQLCAAAGAVESDVRRAVRAARILVAEPDVSERSGPGPDAADAESGVHPRVAFCVALHLRLEWAGIGGGFAPRVAAWATQELYWHLRHPGREAFDFPLLTSVGGLSLEVGDGRFVRMRRLRASRAERRALVEERDSLGGPLVPWTELPAGAAHEPDPPTARVRPVILLRVDLVRLVVRFRRMAASAGRDKQRRGRRTGSRGRRRSDLTDAQWRLVMPLLTTPHGRPPSVDRRVILDAIRYREATGCSWRDLPPEYQPWTAVQTAHGRWGRDGTLEKVRQLLENARPADPDQD